MGALTSQKSGDVGVVPQRELALAYSYDSPGGSTDQQFRSYRITSATCIVPTAAVFDFFYSVSIVAFAVRFSSVNYLRDQLMQFCTVFI